MIKGFSPQNLWYMREFYLAWNEDGPILQRPVGELAAGRTLQQSVGELARKSARAVPKLQRLDPTISLLLCKARNRLVAEYALRDIRKPIGVAAWATKLTRALPANLKPSLPTVEEIEAELARDLVKTVGRKAAAPKEKSS